MKLLGEVEKTKEQRLVFLQRKPGGERLRKEEREGVIGTGIGIWMGSDLTRLR